MDLFDITTIDLLSNDFPMATNYHWYTNIIGGEKWGQL
jgi:hypothetical protein